MTSVRWTADDLKRYEQRHGLTPQDPITALPDVCHRRGMNKTESLYALELETRRIAGEIRGWRFEGTRLQLTDGAWYKPDFTVACVGGEIEMHEIKGHWREAARLRIKFAAKEHPWYRFIALRRRRKREGGGWALENF